MYQISVYLPDAKLIYHVLDFKRIDGRVTFIDAKTGTQKDFPDYFYVIEEEKK